MGVFSCCAKTCGLIVLALAILIGWMSTQMHPMGIVFRTVFQLQGMGKPGTEPVPDDLTPQPRPQGEMMFELPGGDKMPAAGLGMCCRPSAYDPVSVHRTVLWFLLQGGRHIDTASVYMNHEAVGLGIRDAMARGVPRKDIFLVTKVFPDHYGYQESIQRTEEMVKELGVDYIDMVLIHAPIKLNPMLLGKFFWGKFMGGTVSTKLASTPEMVHWRHETWKGLSAVRERGLVRNVGVSNFNIEHLKGIQALKLAPIAANQMQYHPWAPDWMKDIVKYCQDNKIIVTGYFSLGGHDHKDKAFGLEELNSIAKSHGRRPAQILLRWSLQHNVSIIPGTGNHKHMADNLNTFGFQLSDSDMAKLDGMQSLPIAEHFMFFDF